MGKKCSSRQVGCQRKGILMNIIVFQSSCLWVGQGSKEPNLQNPLLAAFGHFGTRWKAIIVRFETFELRQIEVCYCWWNWSTLCAFKICFWCDDLKTNNLGSRPGIMKIQEIRRNGLFWPICLNFEGAGGGWKQHHFQKIFLDPLILYISTVTCTCIFMGRGYAPPSITI